jgi:hypothetical protein
MIHPNADRDECLQEITALETEISKLEAENWRLRAALEQIELWSSAYPLTAFPEPDFKKAHRLLQAGGMTLDAISADTIRHVVKGVGNIARRALEEKP